MKKTSLEKFKQKAFKDKTVKERYDALAPAFILRKQLIRLRKKAGLTQEQIAEAMKTQKSNISRLENAASASSPKLSTIERYAKAAGYDVEIKFVARS